MPIITKGCKLFRTDRGSFDLTPISGANYPTASPTGNQYYDLTICANTADTKNCRDPVGEASLIQSQVSTRDCWKLAYWDSSGKISSTSNGFNIVFENGSKDGCDKARTSKFIFECFADAEVGAITVTEDLTKLCYYDITVPTMYVCDDHILPNSSSGAGLSDGSIFLIALLVLIAVYCIVGFGFNKYKGSGGLEAVPQASFWCTQLPFWVKTGFMVTWAFIVGVFLRCKAKITGSTPPSRSRTDTDGDGAYENLD